VIFTALGLLALALALLVAGIAKSSVLLLMLCLVCTVAAGAVLAVAYSIARRTGLVGAAPGAGGVGAGGVGGPIGAPQGLDPTTAAVVMYVPVDQLPTMSPAGAAMKAAAAAGVNGNGSGSGVGAADGAPLAGYDEMSAEQVGKLVTSGALSESQLQTVREYEAAHAARKTVLDRIDRALYRA
jgi:hypothetical protein